MLALASMQCLDLTSLFFKQSDPSSQVGSGMQLWQSPSLAQIGCRHQAHHDCCRFDGVIPSAECEAAQPALAELSSKLGPLVQQYVALMERIKLKDGIRQAMNVSFAGNKFFQASRGPLPCS